MRQIEEYTARQADVCREHDSIDLKLYSELGVKRDCETRMVMGF